MPQDYEQWLKAQKNLPPVFAFGGKEVALVEEAYKWVRKRIFNGDINDFNYERLNAKEASLEQILCSANTLPMGIAHRLVEVFDAQYLMDDVEKLSSYVKEPCPTTLLVFVFRTVDLRKKAFASFERLVPMFLFEQLKEYQMVPVVRRRAKAMSLQLDGEAASVLAFLIGTDLMLLDRALEKLQIAVEDETIGVSHIADHISNSHLENAFHFSRAVASGERKRAMKRLYMLQSAREAPLRLVGLLAWQLRNILQTRLFLDDGISEREIAGRLHLYGEQKQATLTSARAYSPRMHTMRLLKVRELDETLKSSSKCPWLHMERLVLQLCR